MLSLLALCNKFYCFNYLFLHCANKEVCELYSELGKSVFHHTDRMFLGKGQLYKQLKADSSCGQLCHCGGQAGNPWCFSFDAAICDADGHTWNYLWSVQYMLPNFSVQCSQSSSSEYYTFLEPSMKFYLQQVRVDCRPGCLPCSEL